MYSAMGGSVSFSDPKNIVIQKINQHLADKVATPDPIRTVMPDDHRLRTVPPAKNMDADSVRATLAEFIERGLKLDFPEPNQWTMRLGKRCDSGSLRVPLRVIVQCAREVMRG